MNLRCKKGQLAMITCSNYNNGKVVTCLELTVNDNRFHEDFGKPSWIVDTDLEERWQATDKFRKSSRRIADFRLTPINDPDLDICTEETEEIQKENQHA